MLKNFRIPTDLRNIFPSGQVLGFNVKGEICDDGLLVRSTMIYKYVSECTFSILLEK